MKFKDFGKRFLTLDRRHAAGFTLVELIVVIAILAILGGVAVPAYGGYVKKANMQADMSLISEIEQALELAYYSQDLPEGSAGYVILMPDAPAEVIDEEANPIVVPMQKVFGDSWKEILQLKHDDWGVTNLTMDRASAQAVVDSNFVQKYSPSELMAQVTALTTAVDGLSSDVITVDLKAMYDYNDGKNNAIDDVIAAYGITESWDEMDSTEQSNLLVLATASSITNNTGAGANTTISNFAQYTAFAAEDPEFNTAYQDFQKAISSVDPEKSDSELEQVKSAYRNLQSAATANGFDTWKSTNGSTNSNAFSAIMAGVGNAMKDNKDGILAELGSADMFTSGIGSELYDQYLGSAYAIASDATGMIAGLLAELQAGTDDFAGCVIAWYSVSNGNLYIGNSLPQN